MPDHTPYITFPHWRHRDCSWWDRAACRGTRDEAFFPERGGASTPARLVCARCPVWRRCLDDALDWNPPIGIWGGTHLRERQKIRAGQMSVEAVESMLRALRDTHDTR